MRYFLLILLLTACGGSDRIHLGDTGAGGNSGGSSDGGQVTPLPPSESCRARGFNFVCWYPGCFQEPTVTSSIDAAKSLGANWFAVVPTWYQASQTSSQIYPDSTKSATLDDLRAVIALAQSKGFQILLKPHIDLNDGSWRGQINPTDLAAWQSSYRDFIFTMADLSQETGVSILAIGTELKTRSGDVAFWRDLIAGVRARYSGKLTYAANWDEYDSVTFWDLLDDIGIDFYFPLTNDRNATEAQMEAALQNIGNTLESFSASQGKPFLFTEIGYRNIDGTNTRPYDYGMSGATDNGEQADAYQAVLNAFAGVNWLDGIFWWRWDIRLSGASDEGYLIYGKPAADMLSAVWNTETCL